MVVVVVVAVSKVDEGSSVAVVGVIEIVEAVPLAVELVKGPTTVVVVVVWLPNEIWTVELEGRGRVTTVMEGMWLERAVGASEVSAVAVMLVVVVADDDDVSSCSPSWAWIRGRKGARKRRKGSCIFFFCFWIKKLKM